jgi:hypothetical protein
VALSRVVSSDAEEEAQGVARLREGTYAEAMRPPKAAQAREDRARLLVCVYSVEARIELTRGTLVLSRDGVRAVVRASTGATLEDPSGGVVGAAKVDDLHLHQASEDGRMGGRKVGGDLSVWHQALAGLRPGAAKDTGEEVGESEKSRTSRAFQVDDDGMMSVKAAPHLVLGVRLPKVSLVDGAKKAKFKLTLEFADAGAYLCKTRGAFLADPTAKRSIMDQIARHHANSPMFQAQPIIFINVPRAASHLVPE